MMVLCGLSDSNSYPLATSRMVSRPVVLTGGLTLLTSKSVEPHGAVACKKIPQGHNIIKLHMWKLSNNLSRREFFFHKNCERSHYLCQKVLSPSIVRELVSLLWWEGMNITRCKATIQYITEFFTFLKSDKGLGASNEGILFCVQPCVF